MTQQKFSLFQLEKDYMFNQDFKESCFIYLDTFDSLEAAQEKQQEYDFKTIILPSY